MTEKTIDEVNALLRQETVKILGTTAEDNTIVVVKDVVIPELTIDQQAIADAITPSIGADGNWYIGSSNTGIKASNFLTSPDGSVWQAVGIDNTGTNIIWSKVLPGGA